jgi:DDE superfamily endonuclease
VGYGFKSRLIFYEARSKNGKLTQEVYLNKILKEEVQVWLDRGDSFILEEDQDSGHGPAENRNAVRRWTESVGLEYFFNASGSPDLAPIENVWRAQKQKINDFDHFDDATLLEGIHRAWDAIPQSTIDRYIDSMVKRLQSLARRDGDVTEY